MSIVDRLSFQLYSARKFPPLDRQLATLAELGFRNVEPYGDLLDNADELKAGLLRHGLKAPSTHVSLDRLTSDRAGFVRQAHDLGVTLAVIPAISHEQQPVDAAGWRRLGESLSVLQQALSGEGIRLGWHNHDFEFVRFSDGSVPLDHLLDAAPGLIWEADIGWLQAAGQEPVDWLTKYAGRIPALHVKDAAPAGENADQDGWTDIGAGVIDWGRLTQALQATQAELLVLEHDNPTDFEGFARRSREAIASW